jgi:putative Holliday junction resolvase
MPRILGIDHGTVRIGLALSDEMELVASPLTTLQNGPHIMAELARLIRAKHVAKVVIGLPIRMDGQKGTAIERVEKFADLLGKALEHAVPIEFSDERLSSKTAERALKREGHEIDPKEGIVDQLAATILLQDYLNSQRGPESYLLPDDSFEMPWMSDSKDSRRRHD